MPNRRLRGSDAAVLPRKRRACRFDELGTSATRDGAFAREQTFTYGRILYTLFAHVVNHNYFWLLCRSSGPVVSEPFATQVLPQSLARAGPGSDWFHSREVVPLQYPTTLVGIARRPICHESSRSDFKTGSAEIPGLGRDWARGEPDPPLRFADAQSRNLRGCRSLGGNYVPAR